MKCRKGSISREIQDWLTKTKNNPFDYMINHPDSDCCFNTIGKRRVLAVMIDWQGSYDPRDKTLYGVCMNGDEVLNISLKVADECSCNGSWALYAESFVHGEDYEIEGGISLHESDKDSGFYDICNYLGQQYASLIRLLNLRR